MSINLNVADVPLWKMKNKLAAAQYECITGHILFLKSPRNMGICPSVAKFMYAMLGCIKSYKYYNGSKRDIVSCRQLTSGRKVSRILPRSFYEYLYSNKPIANCGGTSFVLGPDQCYYGH